MTRSPSVNHGTGWRAIRATTATSFGSSTRYVSFIPPSAYRTTANEQVQPIASSWPWALIAVGIVLVGLLATNELFNTRLRPEGAT